MTCDSSHSTPADQPLAEPSVPPEISWSFQWSRLLVVLGIPLLLGGLAFLIGHFDLFIMQCGFRFVTGLHCPGCGMTRMVHAIFDLRLKDAFFLNPFMLLSIPILIFLYLCWSVQYAFNRKVWGYGLILRFWWIWFVLAILFAILRNMPYLRDFFAL